MLCIGVRPEVQVPPATSSQSARPSIPRREAQRIPRRTTRPFPNLHATAKWRGRQAVRSVSPAISVRPSISDRRAAQPDSCRACSRGRRYEKSVAHRQQHVDSSCDPMPPPRCPADIVSMYPTLWLRSSIS